MDAADDYLSSGEESDVDMDAQADWDEQPVDEYASAESDAEFAPGDERKEVARSEKSRLKDQEIARKAQLEKVRKEQQSKASAGDASILRKRMKFLAEQAEVFQHFAGEGDAKKKKKGKGRRTEDAELAEDQALMDNNEADRAHRLTVQPACIKSGTMREYQIQGLNWLIHLYDNGVNGILADEMGLGKTLQTISLIGYLSEARGITGPHLVIVPKSTLGNWMKEFRKWCPMVRAMKFHGNREQREEQKAGPMQLGAFDVCITSYEMIIKEKNHFRKFHFRYMIIDEAHRIKNENSILSKVIRMIKVNYRLLITGTPLQNNLHELWALLNFLLPEIFESAERFEEWFEIQSGDKEQEAEVVQQLHKVLRPFLLRRVKSDVERGMPKKRESILKIGMSEVQKEWYRKLLSKDATAIAGSGDRSRLLNIVMQLRKCCNHPYLFQGVEPGPPYLEGNHLMANSGKMTLLDKLLPRLKQNDSRVLIFSQMTRMIDILEDYCRYKQHAYCRIDGNTSGDDREASIDAFNAPGSEKFIFLLSTRAGGLGINLATADIVIIYDSDWNPQMDLQAMDRAHRIGQKKEVQVFRLCIENSIEEKVIEKAYKKLRLDALVIQQGRMTEKKSQVNKDDLLAMVRYGAETVFSSEPSAITDADIEAILQKGEKDTSELNAKITEFTEDAARFTMDGGIAYDFKSEEEKKANALAADVLKRSVASHIIEGVDSLPERRAKTAAGGGMNAKRGAAGGKGGKGAKTATGPKPLGLADYQFFDLKTLNALLEKEYLYDQFVRTQTSKEAALRGQGVDDAQIDAEMAVDPVNDPQPLTPEDQALRKRLMSEGFTNWSKKDFQAFQRAAERYGREKTKDIAREIDSKTEEEVKAYSAVFWSRGPELENWEQLKSKIEKGEEKLQRQKDVMNAITKKLEGLANPWQDLKIYYTTNKSKAFTEEEDRFIVCMMHQLGYGNWDELKGEIRKSYRFRFDWFFKSRTPQELHRRCEQLIKLIEKENMGDKESKGGEAKRRKMASGSAAPDSAPDSPRKA